METIHVVQQGSSRPVDIESPTLLVRQLLERLSVEFGLVNIKLVLKGGKLLTAASNGTCGDAGESSALAHPIQYNTAQ